jgi:hypothetical protein
MQRAYSILLRTLGVLFYLSLAYAIIASSGL